jgi:hypothetical protein
VLLSGSTLCEFQIKSDNAVPTEAHLSPPSSPFRNIYTPLIANIHDDGTKAEFKEALFHALTFFSSHFLYYTNISLFLPPTK